MRVDLPYKPLPVHAPFHACGTYERALVGAFGSGKSYAVCAEAIAWCLEQPGIRGLITRKTIPELRDTTETVFFDILPQAIREAGSVSRIGGHYSSFTFPNGSMVLFRGIDDWQKHKSLNVGFIAWDEADEFDEETYLGMSSRVRQRDITSEARALGYVNEITRRGMWMAFNPAGHNWIYRRFVDPKTAAPNTEWFRSTSFDNPYLPPEYINALLQYPEPWIRRYVLAQFDDFAGQIFEAWAWDTHVIEPLKEYGRTPVFWMGMDPGTESPTAGLWAYIDQEKRRLVGIAEYQEASLNVMQHTAAFRRIEAQHKMKPAWRVADPTVTTRDRGTNMRLSDQYARLGYRFALGPKSYDDRIPALGTLIAQGRFVVTRNCPQTYESIKDAKWEDLTPAQRAKGAESRERPVKGKNSHLGDCAQYLASRWIKPLDLRPPAQEITPTQEIWNLVHKQNRRSRANRRRGHHDLGNLPV